MADKFDAVKEKVGAVAKTAYDKTVQLAKIAQLKVEIKTYNIQLNGVYKKLGRMYYTYNKTENINNEEVALLIKEADVIKAKIAPLERELFVLRNKD